jgi:hypothetical protein
MEPTATTRQEASTLYKALDGAQGGDPDLALKWVRRFLEKIRDGECAPTAQLHPLGFHCIPVYRSDEFGLCVHGWLPGARRETSPTSDMHMHTYDMTSMALHGSFINRQLDLVEAGPKRYRIFEIDKEGGENVDAFTDTGLDTAVLGHDPVAVSAGEIYAIRSKVCHSADETVRNQDFTVTLMLAKNWDNSPQRTLVELERVATIPSRYERRLLSPSETRCAALEIGNLLESAR